MARIVLKISGEYLGGEKGFGFDEQVEIFLDSVTNRGNFFRGNKNISLIDRVAADNIGMLATIMNGLFLQSNYLGFFLQKNLQDCLIRYKLKIEIF